MSIALLGSKGDPQLLRVAQALDRLGESCHHLDTGRFPESFRLCLGHTGVTAEGSLVPIPTAVYVRGLACHPLMPSMADLLDEHPRRVIAAQDEKRALLESIVLQWQSLGTRLVNAPEANAQHSRKPYQLSLLQRAGLPVPPWIATNDPADLHQFLAQHGASVFKPLAGGATVRMVEAADLAEERLAQLAAAPVLFQDYIPGVAVRAYVVEGRVVAAAEIHSDELDYRRDEGAVVPATLTELEAAHAVQAARACGMPFTGVDFIRAKDASWVLECNPSPMFAVFEDKTGLDVATPLAICLAGRAN